MASLGATWGYLENLQLGMWETLLDPPRHLETSCCSNGCYTTGNSETSSGSSAYSDNHVHTSALSSCWEWGKCSVFPSLQSLPGTYYHLNSLHFPSEPAPLLPQGIFSGLELEKPCLLSSEISPNPLSYIHGANRQSGLFILS